MNTFNGMKFGINSLALLLGMLSQLNAFADVSHWTFSGAQVGMGFRTFVRTADFGPPCDTDPINDGTRSVAFFPAKPCRGIRFPEATTVILFTTPAITPENLEAPVTTVAWMGGTYFNSRSDFPVRIGSSIDEAALALGAEVDAVTIRRRTINLRIARHAADIHSLSVDGKVVGFIIGRMPATINPESEDREEWRAVVAGYFEFTMGAGTGTPSEPGNPPSPGNPGGPTEPTPTPVPAPEIDPVAETLINELFRGLKITDNEAERFATVAATLHHSLLRKDGRDFAPGIRDYAYRRACQHVAFYAFPIEIDRVQAGTPTVIGGGNAAEPGRIDKLFVKGAGQYATKPPAPVHVFYPANGDQPSILNFGSL